MQTAQSTPSVNDILGQARQGSVAAIIQILNERLAESQIRTRAILADGVLQLLCEAPTPEQLEQSTVVPRVQGILEELAPKSIRKVNINSRIVREQQLLWFEEITRDPENQLLWSELIKLKQPNPVSRLWQDLQQPKARNEIVVTGVTWVQLFSPDAVTVAEPTPEAPAAPDTFAQAVRLAQQSVTAGQQATTPAEWLDLAARWQRAADLMAQVPSEDERYAIAQDRILTYQQNSDQALNQADQLQQEVANPTTEAGE